MPKPRVYIETTIPSFYFETREDTELLAWRIQTRRWWEEFRSGYELFTSAWVLAELRRGPAQKVESCLDLLADIPLLEDTPIVREVTAYYVEHKLMPSGNSADAAHVAMASVHGMEFLLTWNCRHLANVNKTIHLQVLNHRLGLSVPILTTPINLVPES